MLSWIAKDDPPLLVSNPQVVPAPGNRGEWLHCIHHARAIQMECVADCVPCILVQDQSGRKPTPTALLLQQLLKDA